VGRISASLFALALGAFAAVALASCGSGSSAKLLPGDTAAEITANLDKVKRLAQSHECVGAEDAAQQIASQIDALGGVDKTLKRALREGAARLDEVVSKCGEETTETTETSETATESTPGKPAKKEEKPKKPKPTPSEPPTTKTTTTPTTPTTPTTTTTPTTEGGGGTGPPSGGVGPGAPAGGGK
jgi:outer membrane biosynthesis protein TonB